jgi:cytidine deaminase
MKNRKPAGSKRKPKSGEAMTTDQLVESAARARENAYAPYSNFKVGAALLASSGRVFTGCNVENATYGLTVCAERVALWKAISEGEREFTRIAVVTESHRPASPCGACRQLLWEFCGDIELILASTRGFKETRRLAQLFPLPFDRSFL